MSEPRRLLLAGATGLVGRAVIDAAVGHGELRLVAVARREMPLPEGARMELLVTAAEGWPAAIAAARPNVVLIALGTTIAAQNGDREAFVAIDHDLVVEVAEAALAAGATHCIVVSSVGAAAQSRNFYLSTKGQVEDALGALGFARLDILRPGLLRGARGGAVRLGETLAKIASPVADLMLHGGLRRYRSVPARTVAQAMLALAFESEPGSFVHEHDAIRQGARAFGGSSAGRR